MTTAHSFNQTFFDNVRLHERYRVGAEGDGWRLAKVTLANERVSLSSAGSLWGTGPSAEDLLRLIREHGGLSDPIDRQRAAGDQEVLGNVDAAGRQQPNGDGQGQVKGDESDEHDRPPKKSRRGV